MPQRLRTLLPEATILVLSASDLGDEACDKQVRLYHGMLVDDTDETPSEQGGAGKAELDLKIQALSTSKLFSSLGRKQQRLLAFGARWYKAAPGEYIFHAGDAPDSGVFLIVEGSADLLRAGDDGTEVLVTNVGAGSLVGELGLIRQEPRALHMRASDNLTWHGAVVRRPAVLGRFAAGIPGGVKLSDMYRQHWSNTKASKRDRQLRRGRGSPVIRGGLACPRLLARAVWRSARRG